MSDTQDHSELIHKILSGTRWAAILRTGAQIFSWLSTIIVVRFISPTDYGLNAMLDTPLAIMLLVSTLGLDIALVQSKTLEREALRSVFGWLLIINGTLFLAYFFGGILLAAHFNEPRLETLSKVLSLIFLLAPFRVIPNALLDRELKFKLRAQIELGATLISTVLTLVMAVLGAGIWALVVGVVVNRILQAVLLMIIEPWFVMPALDYAIAHRLMAFGGISTLAGIVVVFSGKAVILTVGPQLGTALLGIYAVSMEFAMLPVTKIMPIINQSLLPAFSKFQSQPAVAGYYMERTLGTAFLVMAPAMIGMACIADIFVGTILGAKWSGAVLPLQLASLMMLMRFVSQLIRPVMTSMGRKDLPLKSGLLLIGLILPASLFGVRYGITGLMFAWLGTEFVVVVATVWMSKQAVDTSFTGIFRSLRPALVSSVVMAAAVVGAKLTLPEVGGWVRLLGTISIGALTYWLALRLLFAEHLRKLVELILGKRPGNQIR